MFRSENINTVLLIEDNPADALLVEILLKESDIADTRLIKAETLKEGIELLKSDENFAAILLDLTLPDSQGFDTLERLIRKFPNQNIIVLTGYADKQLGLRAVQLGAQDFLQKDAFDANQLSKSLRFSIERNSVLSRLEETQRLARVGNWECHPTKGYFNASDETFAIFKTKRNNSSFEYDWINDKNDDFHFFKKIHERTQKSGRFVEDEVVLLNDGSTKYLGVQCRAIRQDGELFFQGVLQDITERKLAEQESVRSQERYEEIFSQSKDAIIISTFNGQLIDCNPACVDLLKRNKASLLSAPDVHIHFYPPERRNEFLLKLKFQKSVKDFEIDVKQSDGSVRECLISGNLQKIDDLLGYNAIIRDITEQKRTEDLIKARDLARESARLKEQFIASISHEMRTPMNAIFGMSNLLTQTELNEEQKELVGSINQSSEILLGIVNDILEIATIQNGKLVFENKPFDLKELLDNLSNVMQFKAAEKTVDILVEIADNVPSILIGDKLRVNQILYNLVGNAIKFTDKGHVKIRVELLNSFSSGVHLQFMVEDTGIGIPKEHLESVFDSFTRVISKERLFEGTGLGLAISKSLVEQQGGKIWATSELKQGSKFYFDMIFEIQEDILKVEKEKEVTLELDEHKNYHILLVEDHKMNQMVAKKTLSKKWSKVEVTIAENGKIAIELLNKQKFDLILMDVQMPVMDGYEATKYIREQMPESIAKLPILAMTAHANLAKDEKFKEYGMDDYVLKPFQPEELFTKIATYLLQ